MGIAADTIILGDCIEELKKLQEPPPNVGGRSGFSEPKIALLS